MKLYKLENNTLIESPSSIIIDGNGVLNPSDEQLKSIGFKELKYDEIHLLEWYETIEEVYTEDNEYIYINYNIIPNPNLLTEYSEHLALERDRALENDFYWMGKCVKLSESNQRDYGIMYALLSNNKSIIPTFPCNFKNKTEHFFADFDELNNFGIAVTTFVNEQLTIYREETFKIKDMDNDEIYEYLKSKNIN